MSKPSPVLSPRPNPFLEPRGQSKEKDPIDAASVTKSVLHDFTRRGIISAYRCPVQEDRNNPRRTERKQVGGCRNVSEVRDLLLGCGHIDHMRFNDRQVAQWCDQLAQHHGTGPAHFVEALDAAEAETTKPKAAKSK